MKFKKGDLVTRKSYKNDIVFKIINITDSEYILKGVEVRLLADCDKDDLEYVDKSKYIYDNFINDNDDNGDRGDYFYLPAKILHIDGDSDYLNRCLNYYKQKKVLAIGKKIRENNMASNIITLLTTYKPDILIITGHDAYYKKMDDINDIRNYKNSVNFVNTIYEARKYEKSHDKLVIIAGACQSFYEELIKAGANFASSPKRINIHALDPAIIACNIALTKRSEALDLITLLNKTKYGPNGIGGLECNGLMYVGYPR